jgi:thiol:disulfide interchange protein DsbC
MSKTSLLAFLLLFCLLPANHSVCFEGKGQDCSKCHTLSIVMRREISSKTLSPPDIKIINVKSSPSKGLWEVYLESGVKKGFLYVDFARKHFFMGSPTSIKERKNLTQERFAELNKLDPS